MKTAIFYILIFVCVVTIGGYLYYRSEVPDMVARAVVTDSMPAYIPKRIQSRIHEISTPINQGTEAVIREMRSEGIPTAELMVAIDKTSEAEMNVFLDELTAQDPDNIHEVFDIVKKHMPADFDAEILRKPFTEHVTMRQVKKLMVHAQENRQAHDMDFEIAKAVLKKIILEKEKALNAQ